MKTVIFTGGGTLGHLYPAIAVLKKLKGVEPETRIIYFATTHEKELEILNRTPEIDEIHSFALEGIRRKLTLHNVAVFRKLFGAIRQMKKLMSEIHPDLVVGMGGYVSGAVIYAAGRKHIPAIIHEQNAVLGLANRFSLPFVKSVLMSFPVESKKIKIKFIGHPRKDQIEELFKEHPLHQSPHKKILITSGSGGAQRINDVALELLNDPRSKIYDITLVTGPKYYEGVKEKLNDNHGTHFQTVPFINNLPRAMSEVDLVITRCGSTTIFELLGLKKPAIYIPSPNVVQNHQEKNASFITRYHMGEVILEKDLTKERLFDTIAMMLKNPKLETELSESIEHFTDKKALDQFILEIKKWW